MLSAETFNHTFEDVQREVKELLECDTGAASSICSAYTRMMCYVIVKSSRGDPIKFATDAGAFLDLIEKTLVGYFHKEFNHE